MLGLGLGLQYPRGLIGGGGFDPDYEAILAQGTPPSASIQKSQNNLIVEMKTVDDLWTKLRSLQIWRDGVTGGDDFKSIDWKRPDVKATLVSGVTSAATGFQGNGSGAYVNLNYNANDDNPLLDGNVTLGYWSVNGTDGSVRAQIGGVDTGGQGTQIIPNLSVSTKIFVGANTPIIQLTSTGLAPNTDTELITVTNESLNITLRRNNTILKTTTAASTTFFDGNILALCRSVNGTASNFSNDTLSMTIITEELTLAEIAGLKTAFDNYIASL